MRTFLLGAIAMVASCTFPDVQFDDASVPIDTGSDVIPTNDAGNDVDTDAFDPCDMDHDGYKAEGGACGGNDCNDNDPRVNPGQTQFITDVPDAEPFGDWNCDGTKEPLYPFLSCAPLSVCSVATFTTDTGCGITNPFVTCTTPITCAPVDAGTRTQGCR